MTKTEVRKVYEHPALVEIGSLAELTENGTNLFNGPYGPRSGGRANPNANINANPGSSAHHPDS